MWIMLIFIGQVVSVVPGFQTKAYCIEAEETIKSGSSVNQSSVPMMLACVQTKAGWLQ